MWAYLLQLNMQVGKKYFQSRKQLYIHKYPFVCSYVCLFVCPQNPSSSLKSIIHPIHHYLHHHHHHNLHHHLNHHPSSSNSTTFKLFSVFIVGIISLKEAKVGIVFCRFYWENTITSLNFVKKLSLEHHHQFVFCSTIVFWTPSPVCFLFSSSLLALGFYMLLQTKKHFM